MVNLEIIKGETSTNRWRRLRSEKAWEEKPLRIRYKTLGKALAKYCEDKCKVEFINPLILSFTTKYVGEALGILNLCKRKKLKTEYVKLDKNYVNYMNTCLHEILVLIYLEDSNLIIDDAKYCMAVSSSNLLSIENAEFDIKWLSYILSTHK